MFPLFIFGTLLVTAFAVGTIFSVVIQKRRQMNARLQQQQLAFDYQQALLRTKVEVQETTSSAISRELHDHINSNLTGGLMQIRAAANYVLDEKGRELLEEAKELVGSSITQIRAISHNLNTGYLAEGSLEEAIKRELKRIEAFSKINCAFINEAEMELGQEERLLIFRIVQEALQNVLKHAEARHITVRAAGDSRQFILSVKDDGCGFNPSEGSSIGLRNMRERAAMLRGSINIDTAPGHGTTLTLYMPAPSV